ncbi:MAG: pyruvate ferredoxin oxidoreductase, partial [Clostridiaceae bacterium]|nr:pyruvate ferredoxin oxidoreductase [Clostridiaceae bacterium]
ALYGRADGIKAINYIYGLGGRDVNTDDILSVYTRLCDIVDSGNIGEVYNYLGVRE